MAAKAFISGCAGPRLSKDERHFFADERPYGLILFRRNCREKSELFDLVAGFRDAVGAGDAPVLVDQEGGRVQRLVPPVWEAYPPGRVFGTLYRSDEAAGLAAAALGARLISDELAEVGISVDCIPMLDVAVTGGTPAIGDRAYGRSAEMVTALGRAVAEAVLESGLLPVIKHLPGHGRALVDSHKEMPVVSASLAELEKRDFVPFRALADLPIGMTAHLLFTAIDRDRPATLSPIVIEEIIRGAIGFGGLLLSDDLNMEALAGPVGDRAARCLGAGCDVALHCNGDLAEMRAVAAAAPEMAGAALARAEAAAKRRRPAAAFDRIAARDEFLSLLDRAGWSPPRPAEAANV
jgi:beta-N-acetylhexosaminidase